MADLSVRQFFNRRGFDLTAGIRRVLPQAAHGSLRSFLEIPFTVAIYEKWQSLGGENGALGQPVGDLRVMNAGGKTFFGQKFLHGTIIDLGNGTASAALSGGSGGGGSSLPETPYVLTLDKVKCVRQTQGEVGADELWSRLIVSTDRELNDGASANQWVDYKNDNMNSGGEAAPDLVLYSGRLPEIFKLTHMAIEVDLDTDADQVMSTFLQKVNEAEELWFNSGSAVIDGVFYANIALNGLGTAICVADPNPWVKWIGGVAGTLMEVLLVTLSQWYRSELIGADQRTLLGEELSRESSGELPAGTEKIPITISQSSGSDQKTYYVSVSFGRYDNGDIREERTFSGTDPSVSYVFTYRHFLGNGNGVKPAKVQGFALDPVYQYLWNEQHGKSTFKLSENHLSWSAGSAGDLGYEIERSCNGSSYFKVGSVRVHSGSGSNHTYTDLQQSGRTGQETCQYRVRAYNRNGYGPYSDVLTSALPVPAPPYGLSVAPGVGPLPGSISRHVYWMVSSLGDIGYTLERSRGGGPFAELTNVGANVPSTKGANYLDIITDPVPGEKIAYRIKAYNEYGEGPYSEVLNA